MKGRDSDALNGLKVLTSLEANGNLHSFFLTSEQNMISAADYCHSFLIQFLYIFVHSVTLDLKPTASSGLHLNHLFQFMKVIDMFTASISAGFMITDIKGLFCLLKNVVVVDELNIFFQVKRELGCILSHLIALCRILPCFTTLPSHLQELV